MGAYNWILMEAICPSCHERALIRCQCHVASDYAGDAAGRFHDREYRLGERMAWWPEGHPRFTGWREQKERDEADGCVQEDCYADCLKCGAELCVTIRFQDVTPVEVIGLVLQPWSPTGQLP